MTTGIFEVVGPAIFSLVILFALLMHWPWYVAFLGLVLALNGVAIGVHLALVYGGDRA
jgi:hypothetical protein